jgi:hypothetical protein
LEKNYEALENKISIEGKLLGQLDDEKEAHIEFNKMMELYSKRYIKRYENDLSPDEKALFKKYGISTEFKNLRKNYEDLIKKISMDDFKYKDERKFFIDINKSKLLFDKRYHPQRYKRRKEIVSLYHPGVFSV